MSRNDTKSAKTRLTVKQTDAIAGLLEGLSMEAAAARAWVSRATLYRWRRDLPAFQARLAEGQSAAFAAACGKIKIATSAAADELRGLLKSKDENIRRLAAKEILSFSLRSMEIYEFELRLGVLERLSGGRK